LLASAASTDSMTEVTLQPPATERNRWTLTFLDPALDKEYQLAAAMKVADLRLSFLGAAALFLVGCLIVPVVTAVPAAFAYALGGFEVVLNLVAFALVGQLRTRQQQGRASMVLNLLAAVVGISLAAASGRFDLYAAPVLMAVSVVGLVAARLRFTHSVIVAVGYVVIFLAFAQRFATEPVPLQLFFVVAAAAVGAMGTYVLEDAERRLFAQSRLIATLHAQVDRLFHQYLSPAVADTLLTAPERTELGGEVVEVSVLFADLQGFTSFSERTDPAAVVRLLNAYFDAAVPPILGEGGTIIQFAGDAVMAIFNAPHRHTDHARRAGRAALAMQAAIEPIATGERERPRFRIGIATGPALVGNIGSTDVRNFTAIGDTTNLAARLQTFAEPGHVVISERTLELLGPADVAPLGAPALKGKSLPVAVYDLRALREDAVDVGAALAANELPSRR
jgi:class 3 adenylate cyclase